MNCDEKWCWKMMFCKENGFPPAQEWAWSAAEEAYIQWRTTLSANLKK